MSRVSVVVPSWNTADLTLVCLRHLFASDRPVEQVVLVDNGSVDGSADRVAAEFPQVELVRNQRNEGFAKGCNQGIERATGDHVLLLNTDTEVAPDAVRRLSTFLDEHPGHGAVAPRLVHPDGRTQRTCQRFPNLWTPLFFATPLERWWPRSPELDRYFLRDWDQESDRDVDQPPAAALLVRRDVLVELRGFDETLWLFFNDVDLSVRMARAGWRTRYLADARVVHHVGASTSRFGSFVVEWQKNRLAYYRKHHGRLAGAWVKACVGLAFADHALQQLGKRLRGRPAEPVGPVAREFGRFLVS